MADYRSIVIKKADKRSFAVVCHRKGYLLEPEKQLSDSNVYRDVSNTEHILAKSSETSNKMFSSLKKRGFLIEKQMKSFPYKFKNFGKLYLLPRSIKGFIMYQEGR